AGTFAGYVLAQLGGWLAGAWAAGAVLPAGSVLSGTPMIQPGLSPAAAVLLESAATLLLMIVILGSAVGRRATPQTAPILIGFTITAMILALGPLTGAAMNPARHLGPAIVSGSLDGWWIYWLGPAAGATAGTMLWRFVLEPPSTEDS
ncbi:MAG: aquaporin, partial [Fimbriimonadaceae bacterium]|nr:aquaporin [Fimbriimonadaceae bacterium]